MPATTTTTIVETTRYDKINDSGQSANPSRIPEYNLRGILFLVMLYGSDCWAISANRPTLNCFDSRLYK